VKNHAAVLSVLGLAGATLFVAWSSSYKPTDPTMTEEVVEPADFSPPPAPARAGLADESMRDSVAASGPSPMPIPIAGLSMSPRNISVPARPFPVGEQKRARDAGLLAALMAGPEAFIQRRTILGSPKEFRKFLADRRRVDAYLDSVLVRAALRSPAVAKSILTSGPLVRAFLGAPALQDPATVSELLRSPLLGKLLDCPGIQEALSDPAVTTRLVADPATAAFVMDNPQVLKTLSAVVPALGRAFGR
jgi:hypothetical protein